MALFQRFIVLLFLLHHTNSVSFNFFSFQPNTADILYEGEASVSGNALQITRNQVGVSLYESAGRASYAHPVPIWDAKTGKLTDFTTHFSFIINSFNQSPYGDGLSFYLAPSGSKLPSDSAGGYLGLVSKTSAFDASNNSFVAVEFDSNKNEWDPSADHVGININSIFSVANVTWKSRVLKTEQKRMLG